MRSRAPPGTPRPTPLPIPDVPSPDPTSEYVRSSSWGGSGSVGNEIPQLARGISRHDGVGRHITGHHAPGPDERVLADGHVGEDGRGRTDGDTALHERGLDLPVLFGLQLTVDGRPGIGVVDEHHAVPDEDVVLDRHALADERVAGDLAVLSDPGVLLNLDEGADLRVVPDFAAVEIDELRELDALTQLHVRSDAVIVRHRVTALPRSLSDRSAASS